MIVVLHNALERFLWRLVRFGIVASRSKSIGVISNKPVTVGDLAMHDRDTLIDGLLEKWWEDLEWVSLPKKWDALVSLVGNPEILRRRLALRP